MSRHLLNVERKPNFGEGRLRRSSGTIPVAYSDECSFVVVAVEGYRCPPVSVPVTGAVQCFSVFFRTESTTFLCTTKNRLSLDGNVINLSDWQVRERNAQRGSHYCRIGEVDSTIWHQIGPRLSNAEKLSTIWHPVGPKLSNICGTFNNLALHSRKSENASCILAFLQLLSCLN